jgi:hypothetical protein
MDGFSDIIKRLEQQAKAIERALAALRDVEGIESEAAPVAAAAQTEGSPAKRKGGMTPEGKERLVAALKKRWAAKKRAAKKADSAASAEQQETPATKKGGGMTEEGRQRLAEAMKQRWAAKRTAGQAGTAKRGRPKKAA